MHHLNMIPTFPLVSGLVLAIISVVFGEIDLLADPGVINLDGDGVLTLDYDLNDIDLLKDINYDTLQDDDLVSSFEVVDDEVYGADVTVGFGRDDDNVSPALSLPGDDISATDIVVDGEGPAAPGAKEEEGEAEVITTTEKNVQTSRTTDPRLERIAEQLELITLPPDARKRRKIELQLQKISVKKTEEQEKKREDRKQKRLEKREQKKLEKLEKRKEKVDKSGKYKVQKFKNKKRKNDVKKNEVINLLEEIKGSEESVENLQFIKENYLITKKNENFKRSKKKESNIQNKDSFDEPNLITKNIKNSRKSEKKGRKKEEKKLVNKERRKAKSTSKAKNTRKDKERNQRKSEKKARKKEVIRLDNVEKRNAKILRKGKERNLRILQNMIEKEERRVPLLIKREKNKLQTNKKDKDKTANRRKKYDLKVWKSMKEKLIKSKKEIRFLLKLKRGFGARLDNEHKREVAQKLTELKRKYNNGKKTLINFQKVNWDLIKESKLYSKLNSVKKKISYLKKKKKQYTNVPNSKYVMKLSKRIIYFRNKYKETKEKIVLMGKFNAHSENRKTKSRKINPNIYYLRRQKMKSKIEALRKIERKIINETESEYKLKLNEKIKTLVIKYKKYRRTEKSRNETKKEKMTRQLKEKIKSLEKMNKTSVDLGTKAKMSKKRDDLFERYKKLRSIKNYERRNKCYIREDHASKKFLKMQKIKGVIEALKHKRKQTKLIRDSKYRTKLTNKIKILAKTYKKYKSLERIKNETETERKNRKLKEVIVSLMKMRRQSKDQNVKIDLSKKIKKIVKQYKKTRKIIMYENKYECRYFSKSRKIKEKIQLLIAERRKIDDDSDSKLKIRLTKKITNLIKVFKKYRIAEKERNETENKRNLRKLKKEIKTIGITHISSVDQNIKTKLATQMEKLKKKYKRLNLMVKYESRNIDQIRKTYERRIISKYYNRMEKLKEKIKSLIKQKRQIGNKIDPKYQVKLKETIKKLVNMYNKYKRMEKIMKETKKGKKSRIMKEKIQLLKKKLNKATDSKSKERISNKRNDLMKRYKKMYDLIRYEKKNKCYSREDFTSISYLKMETLKENIRILINERRKLGSYGDPKLKLNLKRKIRGFITKYKSFRRKEKISNETKNESKNRNLKEKIKYLMRIKRETGSQNMKANLSKRIKPLVKRYRKMLKIIKYENVYECKYFNRVQKLKAKSKELIERRKQVKGDNEAQQNIILSKRITNLMRKYKKYNDMEKIRKETENGKKMRMVKGEIKYLLELRKEAHDLNKKTELTKKIASLKYVHKKIRLIVKYEEKDMEQISKSYESRTKSRQYLKMQKLKPKIKSLIREKIMLNKNVDSEYKLELRLRIKNLILKYKKYQRLLKNKYHIKTRKINKNKNTSAIKKQIERNDRNIYQRRKHVSNNNIYKRDNIAARKRKQRKLRMRRRREKRGRMSTLSRRGNWDLTRKWPKHSLKSEGRGSDPILPEGMAYCKSKQSNSGGSCQCWYLQDQI